MPEPTVVSTTDAEIRYFINQLLKDEKILMGRGDDALTAYYFNWIRTRTVPPKKQPVRIGEFIGED